MRASLQGADHTLTDVTTDKWQEGYYIAVSILYGLQK